ncbi:tetratricopeptide repeat protein [Nitrospirillum sp. BR 11828]|uniref:tetratricopeptide repeat protein n=1 Tax=Nitrospirillum sp. BR 11828 TaxID=3104325 RepID=UPI002ACA35B6|nr:tetratricopeptide repeat protein [Nitrospirillum sp. BR 11828]MDZ5647890.1 tetratricopeptide repeat protein [Nitrospirillum sp. BR 11828]
MTNGQSPFSIPVPRAASAAQKQRIQSLIQQALTFQTRGQLHEAEQILRQVLALDAAEPDALQLLGLIAKRHGDLDQAEQLLRRSLAVDSRQPHVNYNLGNLLKDTGRPSQALPFYEKAILHKSDYVEAYSNRAECLVALAGQEPANARPLLEAALPLYRRALQLQPDYVAARVGIAEAYLQLDEPKRAEEMLRAGLTRLPNDFYLNNSLGSALRRQQRFEDAAPYLRRAAERAPDRWQIWLNLGNTLLALGQLDEAITCLKKVVVLDPGNYAAQAALNQALWETGQHAQLLNSYEWAKERKPNDPDLLEMAAEAYILFGRHDEAEANIAAAAALRPESPSLPRLRATLLLAQERVPEALEVALEGLKTAPDDQRLLYRTAEAALRLNRPAEALDAARRLGALVPDSQFAVAFEATAHRLMGQADPRGLYDYDRFIHAVDLAAPAGYADLGAFHADLMAALDVQHVAQHEPIEQTLRNGTQTRENLFTRANAAPSILALRDNVLAAARRYIAGLPDDGTHPFLRRKGQELHWAGSWSARLRSQGYHTNHIHPEGWISGCYYVDMPDAVADAEGKQGWITFGAFAQGNGATLPWERAIQPRPGLLVLFPSYMWHGTIPFHGDQTRTTVAFDIGGRG